MGHLPSHRHRLAGRIGSDELQTLHDKLAEGEEHARRIRSLARGLLGPRSERLVQFQLAPLRGGGRKKAGAKVAAEGRG